MKILYIHQYFSTPEGSVGTRSYEFGRRLVAAGHEVTILCGVSHLTHVPAKTKGMRMIRIPVSATNRDGMMKRTWAFFRFALLSAWHAVKADCDLVYASSTPLTVGLPALAARYIRGRRMIFEVRDLWPELPKAMGVIRNPVLLWLLDWFETRCYRGASACVGLSPGIVTGILRKVPGKRVELIPNGCDIDFFGIDAKGQKPKVGNDLSGLAARSAPFTALFCGAHGRANGLDAVLDAAAVLEAGGRTDIRLLFVGDGQLKPALKARAERENLRNCVFVDPVPKHELAGMMAEVQAGLMILADVPAFQYGTSPNKFFDYLAAGLPVLCNYQGWVTDLIRENECGMSTPPGNAEAFANALVRLADDPALRTEQAKSARKLAEREFDRDKLFARMEALVKNP